MVRRGNAPWVVDNAVLQPIDRVEPRFSRLVAVHRHELVAHVATRAVGWAIGPTKGTTLCMACKQAEERY